MRVILSLIFIAGIATAISPVTGQARATALWSDFRAFQGRVQADPAGERILGYGGENENEDFDVLLDRLFHINDKSLATILGYSISGLAAIGLILDFKKSRNANQTRDRTGFPL
jgi:hypothetical protein